jgi:hypothetical protein
MVVTKFQLTAFQNEYFGLYKTETKTAEILDRIRELEQTFDMVELGEIELEEENI